MSYRTSSSLGYSSVKTLGSGTAAEITPKVICVIKANVRFTLLQLRLRQFLSSSFICKLLSYYYLNILGG